MTHLHSIEKIPQAHGERHSDWLDASPGIVTRILGRGDGWSDSDLSMFADALINGNLLLNEADKEDVEGNALLAFLSSRIHAGWGNGLGNNAAEIQHLASALARAGCRPEQRGGEAFHGADSIDLALFLGAGSLLTAWAENIDLTIRRVAGATWMHQASKTGNLETLLFLLTHGGNPNEADENGNTALFEAYDEQVVDLLMQHGADAALRNHDELDAGIYWQQKRGVAGDTLTKMIKARGQVGLSKNPKVRLTQFLALSRTKTAKALEHLKTKMQVSGEGRDGLDNCVVTAAIERLAVAPIRESQYRKRARQWLVSVAHWPEAMKEAGNEEIGAMALVAEIDLTGDSGNPKESQRIIEACQQELQRRGSSLDACRWESGIWLLERKRHYDKRQEDTPLITVDSGKPNWKTNSWMINCLTTPHESMSCERTGYWVAKLLQSFNPWQVNDDHKALSGLHRAIKATQCANTPELMGQLLRLGMFNLQEFDGDDQRRGEMFFQMAEKMARDGCRWDTRCDDLLNLASDDIRRRLTAVHDLSLDSIVATVTPGGRRGARL